MFKFIENQQLTQIGDQLLLMIVIGQVSFK